MNLKATLIGISAFGLLVASSFGAAAETAKEKALSDGAKQFTSKEITERFAGKTVTFVTAAEDKKFLIYYSSDNDIAGKMVGGNWSDTGFYGIADNNTICLSWNGSDKPRLRCMHVLLVDGVVKKFTADGSLSGSIVKFEDGKIL
jgi:hypothetical protein